MRAQTLQGSKHMPQNLIHELYKIGAVKFGEFTLKSGKTSKIYLDLRQIVSYPEILRSVADAMWAKIQGCKIDLICGVPYTALPVATCLSLDHNIPMVMRRKEKKGYGTKQQVEGKFQAGQTCLIVEDVITTGGSILETAEDLEDLGLKINDLVILIDREQGGRENLTQKNYTVHAVFTLSEILNDLFNSDLLPSSEKTIVTELLQG